ncbi:MAG: hypothetical protein ACPGVN_02955 [Alphaproteobacteria bacterium]
MKFKSLIAPVALVATAGLLSACSTTTESLETTDVFAPAAEVAVPAPIPGNAIDFQTLQAPPPIQQVVQAPQMQLMAPPVVQQQPVIEQQFVEAPELPPIPTQQFVEVPQPQYAVGFDCSVIPSSKAGLSEYRANCLAAQ